MATKKIEYSKIKLILWRFIRVGLAGGISAATALKFDLSDPKKLATVLLVAFISGFIEAVMKGVRDNVGYDSFVHKLPL